MIDWIVSSKNTPPALIPDVKCNYHIGNYVLQISNLPDGYIINAEATKALFVFGYILPRLNFQASNNIYKTLLDGIMSKGPGFVNNFKGNFVIIAFFNNALLILNDQMGINKYFYSGLGSEFVASNQLSTIKKRVNLIVSRKNILKYYLLNYFIDSTTVFENCYYATGGTYHKLGQEPESGKYFSIESFIDQRSIIYNRKDSIEKATSQWKDLIRQYIVSFPGSRISQTLTAGMDSRLILAGFAANGYKPSTFTFGRQESMDVVHAKKVASKLGLQHDHIYPDESFFTEYQDHAREVILRTSGMSTVYRAHRMDAYKVMRNKYDILFFGFIGSEIIRGLYPDGLTVPDSISELWLTGKVSGSKYLPESWFDISSRELNDITDEIAGSEYLSRPDLFIFKVMIPLHFAQDIAINESLNVISVAPFWDLDFLDLQKSTMFFTDNKRKTDFAQLGHISRRKGPYFSAKLISLLDCENARMSLGKGYSPSDYLFSMYYAAARFAYYKTIYRSKYTIPNFSYGQWFKNYLKNYFNDHSPSFIGLNKEQMVLSVDNIHGHGELSYLNHVKAVNIDLITTEL